MVGLTAPGRTRALASVLGGLPPGLGQQALARRLSMHGLSGFPSGALVLQRVHGGARMELDPANPVEAEAFLVRSYQPRVVNFIAAQLQRRPGVFFDVGAHIGLVTFQVCALARDSVSSVHAFEPHPLSAARFRRHAQLNPGAPVHLTEAAVGNRDETAVLVSPTNRADGHSYISRENSISGVGSGLVATVPQLALDRYATEQGIDAIEVLKLDVEGHELEVLSGARGLLSDQRIACLVCELNEEHLHRVGLTGQDVVSHMAGLGYEVARLPKVGFQRLRPDRTPGLLTDVVFTRAGRSAGTRHG